MIELLELPVGGQIRIVVETGEAGGREEELPEELRAQVESCWAHGKERFGRLFDGRVLGVIGQDAAGARIDTRAGSFKRYLATTRVDAFSRDWPGEIPGVWMLGVTGFVTGRDAQGTEHVLLGRRSGETLFYGGLWETAPAGGFGVPESPGTLGIEAVRDALAREAKEEVPMDLTSAIALGVPTHLLIDRHTKTTDVVVRCVVDGTIDARAGVCQTAIEDDWEYLDLAWFSKTDARELLERRGPSVAPPGRALLADWLR